MDRPSPWMQRMAVVSILFCSKWALAAVDIRSIEYVFKDGGGQFSIDASGPLTYTQQNYPEEKQIVLDISDAHLSKAASRQLDTSSFDGAVSMISPYQLEDEKDHVRIVIQLREQAEAQVHESAKGLVVSIGGNGAVASTREDTPPVPESQAESPEQKALAEATQGQSHLEAFDENHKTGKYSGRPITLQVKDADVTDVLRLIGDASGFNVIVSSTVAGKITLSLVDVPWDQVLDVVLSTMKLGAERSNNILRVMTLAELTQLKQEQLQTKALAQQAAPRITKVFPISYADLGSITTVLTTFGRSIAVQAQGAGTPAAAAAAQAAVVQSDTRTNSIIVQDTQENVERMKKLIEILDTQTPQVMVEAKIIEASEEFSKNISGSLGLGFGSKGGRTAAFTSFNGGNAFSQLVGSTATAATGATGATGAAAGATGSTGIVETAAGSNSFGASPSVGFLPGVQRVNALISMGETEAKVKLISAPKTIVLHRESATIVQSTPGIIESSVANGNTVTTTRNVVNANVSLNVTPTVTNDESVLLQLNISRDVPRDLNGQTAVAARNITTKVLVDSGSTLVIGGIYSSDSRDSSGGFPFLRKLPIIGALFGNETSSGNRSELFIFVTPRILNTKRAGLKNS